MSADCTTSVTHVHSAAASIQYFRVYNTTLQQQQPLLLLLLLLQLRPKLTTQCAQNDGVVSR